MFREPVSNTPNLMQFQVEKLTATTAASKYGRNSQEGLKIRKEVSLVRERLVSFLLSFRVHKGFD